MHTATIAAADWWARSRGETNTSWITNYQHSLTTRHRDVIVASVQALGPVTSLIEVGCHCGPNLVRLARACPELEMLSGIDCNAEAIGAGQRWMQALGLSDRVEMAIGRVPESTARLADGCVDVVLSCYALAYIAPPDLDAVLYELGRLARRAVVLAEPMTTEAAAETDPRMALSGYREWAHNYHAAAQWIGTWHGMTRTERPVTPPVDRLERVLVAARPAP